MLRTKRLLASGIAGLLALTLALPAQAANPDAARKAGEFVASQISDGAITEVGSTVDSILALFATSDPELAAKADPLVEKVKSEAAGYLESGPEAAAKLAILADALGEDPTTFFGSDLIAVVTGAVGDDGSFGAFPGAFSSSLGITALSRAGADVPEKMVDYLVSGANSDGGFGYAADQPSDADSTGMALLALAAVPSAGTDEATAKAMSWASDNQAEDGSWAGFNPVNSTAVMGMGMLAMGEDTERAVAYLVSVQMSDGALPNEGKPDLLATNQAALLLGGVTFADVTRPLAPTEPSEEKTEPAAPASPGEVATTAPEDDGGVSPLVWGGGLVVLVLGLGTWLAMRRKSNA